MRLLKLAQDSKLGDPGGEGRLDLSIGMVADRIVTLVFGHSVDSSLQILNTGFHSYPTGITMVGCISGRGFLSITC